MTAERVDGELAAAVDDAVLGDVLADLPEAQPDRALTSATDVSSLYVRHRSGLAAHARRFLRDSRDVDEVVQETFLRLFLAIGEIETELQAIAFARRTLTNLCIDRYRADKRRPMLVNLDAAPVGDLSEDWSDDDPVLRAEDAAIVREALAQLSPLHRAALVKREIEEKPLPQIAAELEIPEDSVKHLLFRARRSLRRLLVGTSVEPGVDLTAAEMAAIANRRAGAAMMRGANVLIVLFVGAVVAAVGVRSLEGRAAQTSSPTFDSALPATDLGAGSTSGAGPDSAPHHPHSTNGGHQVVRLHQLPPAPLPGSLPVVSPVQHPPLGGAHHPTPAGGTFAASRGHFKLSGPLEVQGAPKVESARTVVGDGGQTTTATSTFSAATSEGTFQLAQTISSSDVQGDTVSVSPSFLVGDAVETPDLTGSGATISTADDGSVEVSVLANAAPNPTTNAFPLTSMTVHLVLSAGLDEVLSESVMLSTEPPAQASAPVQPAPPVPTTESSPPSAVAPDGPTPSPGTVAGDTSSGLTPGSQAGLPGVLEISDKFGDDRAQGRSFSTSDGVSS